MLLILVLLPYLSWAMPEGCFTRIRNHTLIGTVVVTLDNVSVLQCQHACLEAKKQSCRSLMYHPSKKRCYLNSEDMKTRDSQFFAVLDAVDYYHRTCYYKPSMPVKRESVFEDKCYEIIKGKVLIGIVDQLIQDVTSLDQCKRRCQKSKEASDIVCKSAIYYEKEKECIIASQSRSDIPDLFIEDDQAIYIENTCLSQSTSTIKKLQTMGETVPKMTTQETSPGTEPPTTVQHTELSSSITTVPQNTVGNGKPPQILRKTPISTVELSGYETPSETVSIDSAREDVITTSTTTTTTTTTEAPTTSFDAKVIDTYNVDSVVKVPSSSGYGRRLRDARVKECFTEVRPLRPMDQTRITKAYSLEQCTDICRLCWRCLHGKQCEAVAFDVSRDLCALSSTHIVDGGSMQDMDGIVYHNRHNC
ncbi:hypothetical protein Aduo_015176 [Ancylostoma duodenale]